MKKGTQDLVLSALLLAIGILLPVVFHLLGISGSIFSPMHIPVLIGGFFLPWYYACLLGLLLPPINFLITSMPPFPIFLIMMGEQFIYGALVSLLFRRFRAGIYPSLITGMVLGRGVYLVLAWLVLSFLSGLAFDLKATLSSLFVLSLPGIIVQLIFIPMIVKLLLRERRLFFK